MSVNKDIWMAIKARIKTLSIDTITWPTDKFIQPASTYARVAFISSAPERILIKDGMKHDRSGMVIITFIAPLLDGLGLDSYINEADKIAKHFKDGTKMVYNGVCVQVPSYPRVGDGFEQDGYWCIPVGVPWRTFA